MVIKNIGYSFILKGFSVLVNFLYIPLLLAYLGDQLYGIWITLTSIVVWFSFFDVGLGNGLRNKLTESITNKNNKLSKKLVSTTYALISLIFLFILVIFLLINNFLDWNSLLNSNILSNAELVLLTAILFSFVFLRFIFQLINTVLYAKQKQATVSLINFISQFIAFILVFLLIQFSDKSNILILCFIISAVPVIVLILSSVFLFQNKLISLKPNFSHVDFSLSKDLINLGFKFFFLQISYILLFTTSNFIIANFYGPEAVTEYHIAFKYFQLPFMILSIILAPMWSAITEAYSLDDFIWLNKTLKKLQLVSYILILFIILMFLLQDFVIRLWINEDYEINTKLSYSVLFYSISQIFIAPYSYFINGSGKLFLSSMLTIISILTYGILIYFSSIFSNSSYTIVLSMLISNLIFLIFQPIQVLNQLKKSKRPIWNR